MKYNFTMQNNYQYYCSAGPGKVEVNIEAHLVAF